MKKIIKRLLIFLIGLPVAIYIVLFLPQKHHLATNIITIILSALGSVEFAGFLKKKNNSIAPVEAAILGSSSPLAMTMVVSFGFDKQITSVVFIICAFWLLVSRVFSSEKVLKDATNQVAGGFAVMMYPGLFMAWIIKMALWDHSEIIILIFLLIVMLNDAFAWGAGMVFGKGNQGIISASPNKSIAGFIGGLVISILIGLGAALFIPEIFSAKRLSPLVSGIILGLLSSIAANLGDLGESALKRSSDMKDSGTIIPGRGGVLDTIDSLCLAAPVYYASYWFLFN